MRTQTVYRSLMTLSFVGLLSACGGGGGGGGGDDAPAAATSAGSVSASVSKGDTVTGGVTKGPVNGATVLFYPVDQFGFPLTTEIARASTNAAGNFTVTLPAGAGTVLVESFGGSFIDEADRSGNRVIQLGPNDGFSSILPSGSARVAINPITDSLVIRSRELAASEGGFGGIFNTSRAAFASEAGFDAFSTVPANPTAPAAGASLAEKQYALLLGGLANAINILTVELGLGTPTYEVIRAVTLDLVDGELNGLKYGDPVRVQGANGVQNLARDVDLETQVNRFKNNNAAAYSGIETPVFDFSILANRAPTANAGVDQTVPSGVAVTLDGTASNDPEGGLLYNWEQVSGPVVSLSDATTASPTFTASLGNAVVVFRLTVTDAANATATDTVTVTLTNALPTASAAVDQTVTRGVTVTLDGNASNDPDGALSFNWVQTAGPIVSLTGATTATPTFTAPNILIGSGAVAFTLTVTDAANATATDAVIVNVTGALPRKFAVLDQGEYGDGIGENIGGGAIVTLNPDGTGSLLGDTGTAAIQYTVMNNTVRLNYPAGYIEESFSETFFDENSGSEVVVQIEVRPAFIDLTVVQDLVNADVIAGHIEGQILASDTRFNSVLSEDFPLTAYDFAQQIPFVVENQSERMLNVNLSPQIEFAREFFDREELHEDILVFNADGTGQTDYSALSFEWAIQTDGHLRVTYSTGDIADYYHLAGGPTGDIVSTDMTLVTPLVAGDDNLINQLGLSFKRSASRPILTTANTPGVYTGLAGRFDNDQPLPFSIRLYPDGTGLVEFQQSNANEISWASSSFGICWNIDVDNVLVTRRAFSLDPSTNRREATPAFCSRLDGSENTIVLVRDLELFSIVGDQYRFHDRRLTTPEVCLGEIFSPGCETGPLQLESASPRVVNKEILTAVPPFVTNESFEFVRNGPTSVTIDVLVNDLAQGLAIDPTSVEIVTLPNTGTATVDPVTGAITFVRDANTGSENIQYRVADVAGNRSAAASFRVEFDAPVAIATFSAVIPGGVVTLDGSLSTDGGSIVGYQWEQIDGFGVATVILDDPTSVTPSFTAPNVPVEDLFLIRFTLTVTDDTGQQASTFFYLSADADNDGIPDSDELANGLDPQDPNDADLDPDGDGVSSRDEITIHFTDPLDINSAPAPLSSLVFADPNLASCVAATGVPFASSLTFLDCNNSSITDITGIEALESLNVLSLGGNSISDLTPLSGLSQLETLTLFNNNIQDLSPLTSLSGLVSLNVGSNQISDLSPLSSLFSLQILQVYNNQIVDLTPLAGLTGLNSLDVGSNQFTDTSPIDSLVNLTGLYLPNNQLLTLPVLPAGLQILQAQGNQLTQINDIAGLLDLFNVAAFDNNITSLPDLSALSLLQVLEVSGNLLSTLPNLPFSLTFLGARSNQLADIDALAGHTQLETLDLYDNHLTNKDAEAGSALLTLTGLQDLNISNNAIDDFIALNNAITPATLDTDEGRPTITSLTLAPKDFINLDDSFPTLGVTITTSAVTSGQVKLTSPNGIEVVRGFTDNVSTTYPFNAFADQGDWRVSEIYSFSTPEYAFNDFAIGHLYPSFDRIVSITGSQTPDIDPPVLQSLTITPSSVDLTNGPVLVNIDATFSDAASGVGSNFLEISDDTASFSDTFFGSGDTLSLSYLVGSTDAPLKIDYVQVNDVAQNIQFIGFQELISAGFDAEINVTGTLDPALRNSVSGQIYSQFTGRTSAGNPSYQFDVASSGVVGIEFDWVTGSNNANALLILSDDTGAELASDGEFNFEQSPNLGLNLAAGTYTVLLSACCSALDTFELTFLGDVANIRRDSDSDGLVDDVDVDDDNDGISDIDEIANGLDPLFFGDAELDADGDGASNLIEIDAGSDPLDVNSTPPSLGTLIFADPNLASCVAATGVPFAGSLTFLNCNFSSITDITGIEALVSLNALSLGGNSISDLTPLSGLSQLEALTLFDNNIQDLGPLAVLTGLTSLDVGSNQVSDLSPLSSLFSLQNLQVYSNQIVDLTPLAGLTGLNSLDVGSNQFTDTSPIDSLVNLTGLYLPNNQLLTLPVLPAGLQTLHAQGNQLTQINDIAGLLDLSNVAVFNNNITSLPDLSALSLLGTLQVNENLLSTLPNLPFSLTFLGAGSNQLADIDALAGHTQLETLIVNDNHLTNKDAEAGSALLTLTGLQDLNISNNAIDDFIALNNAITPATLDTDEGRPTITSLTLAPNDFINLDDSFPTLGVTITTSAVTSGQVKLTSPNGIEVVRGFTDNVSTTYPFNAFADQGDWRVSEIYSFSALEYAFNDFAIGHLYPSFDRIVSITGSQTPDIDPPALQSLTITPSSVDLTTGPALVDIDINYSDLGTGMNDNFLLLGEGDEQRFLQGDLFDPSLFSVSIPVGFSDASLTVDQIGATDVAENSLILGNGQLVAAGFNAGVNVTGSLDPALRNSVSGQIYSQFKSIEGFGNPSYQFELTTDGVVALGFEWIVGGGSDVLLIVSDDVGTELLNVGEFESIVNPRVGVDLVAGTYLVKLSANMVPSDIFELTFLGNVINIKRDSDSDGDTDDIDDDDDGDFILDIDEITNGSDPLNPFDPNTGG